MSTYSRKLDEKVEKLRLPSCFHLGAESGFSRISPASRISRELRSAGVTRPEKSELSSSKPLSWVNLGLKSELSAHQIPCPGSTSDKKSEMKAHQMDVKKLPRIKTS